MSKIERIQERAFRILYDDYNSDYNTLLHMADSQKMEIKRLRTLALEVFKTINNLNPAYMKDIFMKTNSSSNYPNNLMFLSIKEKLRHCV